MLEIPNAEYDSYSGEMAKAPYICVYSDGKLIGGTEPDGSTPILSAGPGDVNKDGKINAADLTALQKYLVKKITKLADKAAADLDSNKKLNIFDVIILRRILLSK